MKNFLIRVICIGILWIKGGIAHSSERIGAEIDSSLKICTSYSACGFQDPDLADDPFIMTHGAHTSRVALLVHGLSDSPFYMKDIANTLFNQGMNVVAIRLSGHGERNPYAALTVKYGDWLNDFQNGVRIAKSFGDRLVLGGLSTGASVVLHQVLSKRVEADGLFLFSPATRIANPWAFLTCFPFILGKWTKNWMPEDPYANSVKFRNRATNAVCQLHKLINAVDSLLKDQNGRAVGFVQIPTFVATSLWDTTIDPGSQIDFVRNAVKTDKKMAIVFTDGSQRFKKSWRLQPWLHRSHPGAPVLHSGVPLETNEYLGIQNPAFGTMKRALEWFAGSHLF